MHHKAPFKVYQFNFFFFTLAVKEPSQEFMIYSDAAGPEKKMKTWLKIAFKAHKREANEKFNWLKGLLAKHVL